MPQPMESNSSTCMACWCPIIDCEKCGAKNVYCGCDSSVENHGCLNENEVQTLLAMALMDDLLGP